MEQISKARLEQSVKELIANKLGVELDEVSLSSRFAEDLSADSLDAVECVMLMEHEFDIYISDAESEKVHTVGDLYEICLQKLIERDLIIN